MPTWAAIVCEIRSAWWVKANKTDDYWLGRFCQSLSSDIVKPQKWVWLWFSCHLLTALRPGNSISDPIASRRALLSRSVISHQALCLLFTIKKGCFCLPQTWQCLPGLHKNELIKHGDLCGHCSRPPEGVPMADVLATSLDILNVT